MGQNGWNFIFSLFFLGVLGAALYYIGQVRGYPTAVPPFDVLLMALAAFRITRLLVHDKIAQWFRDLFKGDGGFAATVRDLLACPWCVGFWAALVVAFAYFVYPWAWVVILFLAIAALGSMAQVLFSAIVKKLQG